MTETSANDSIKHLMVTRGFGQVTRAPQQLHGGLLHKMYALETTTGKFVVKVINPTIIKRPTARDNYVNSERVAQMASRVISAVPALAVDGEVILEMAGEHYLIFKWHPGTTKTPSNIESKHCQAMGKVLGAIHAMDFTSLELPDMDDKGAAVGFIDFSGYLKMGRDQGAQWVEALENHLTLLEKCLENATHAAGQLAQNRVISHRDMDPKNVLWQGDKPIIIDWEAAGYVNPHCELVETGVYWATGVNGAVDYHKLLCFLSGYEGAAGKTSANWGAVLDYSVLGKLEWLEYNLKRSLWLECKDQEEQVLGTEEVLTTIHGIVNYVASMDAILEAFEGGTIEKIIEDIKDKFQIQCDSPTGVTGGFLNRKWKVNSSIGPLLIKEFSPRRNSPKKLAAIERALLVQRQFHHAIQDTPLVHVFNQRPLQNLESSHYMVMSYTQGIHKCPKTITDTELFNVGKAMAKLHQLNTVGIYENPQKVYDPRNSRNPDNLLAHLNLFLQRRVAENQGLDPQHRLHRLTARIQEIYDQLTPDFFQDLPVGFAHADFSKDNILFNKEEPILLDFDRGHIGYQLQDLGRVIMTFVFDGSALHREKLHYLVSGYGEVSPITPYHVKRALQLTWMIEVDYWMHPFYFEEKVKHKLVEFREEIAWLTENWFELDSLLE